MFATSASHDRLLVQALPVLLPIQLSAQAPGKAVEDGPNARALATHVGMSSEVSSPWLPFGPAPAIPTVWEVDGRSISLSLPFFLCHSAHQTNKQLHES